MTRAFLLLLIPGIIFMSSCDNDDSGNNAVVDLPDISGYLVISTKQNKCYNNISEISCPVQGEAFYGQDVQYSGNEPS